MRKERIPFLVTLLLLCAACGGGGSRSKSEHIGQNIVISDAIFRSGGTDTVRFGSMRTGEIAVKPLVLHNTLEQPIVITECTHSCGCTTLEFQNQPFNPDEKRPAQLIFDARGLSGWQFKLMEVRFAGCTKPLKIYIEAEVE